ncbi:Transcription initiation factor TFIID subunit 4b [Zea mays]|uniref:Transcription initiation factor TFIID subunit 4b n=2 Tax=Zea mays TaxID=4577 RepID=A0A1D6KMB3_MAIZE|nr:Transcription initiation factor TFIID subunit 4b [Zea mays]
MSSIHRKEACPPGSIFGSDRPPSGLSSINEVSKEYFLKTVSNIVGDKLLKQAASQYQMQAQRSPQTNPSNYSLSGQVSGQQTAPSGSVTGDEQKGYPWAHTIPMRQAIASTRPPQFRPSSSGQMRSNTVQTMQHHVQRPQTSSPVFGANSIHARPFLRPVGGPAAPFRPQMADSNPRAHLIQGAVTTISRSVPKRSIVSGNAPVNQALGSSKVSAGMESQSQQLSAPKPLAATSLSQTQSHGIQEEPKIQGKKQLLFESLPATDLKVRASGM